MLVIAQQDGITQQGKTKSIYYSINLFVMKAYYSSQISVILYHI